MSPTPTRNFLDRLDTSHRWALAVLVHGAVEPLALSVVFRGGKWIAVNRHYTGVFEEVPSHTELLGRSEAFFACSAPLDPSERPVIVTA